MFDKLLWLMEACKDIECLLFQSRLRGKQMLLKSSLGRDLRKEGRKKRGRERGREGGEKERGEGGGGARERGREGKKAGLINETCPGEFKPFKAIKKGKGRTYILWISTLRRNIMAVTGGCCYSDRM